MAGWKRSTVLVFPFLVAAWSLAQDTSQRSQVPGFSQPDKVPLEVVSTVPVSSLPSQVLTLPMLCGQQGTIVTRFGAITPTTTTVGDPVAISPEGKIVARFGREKITDVPQPVPGDMFLTDDGLEMLTMSLVPKGYQRKWRTSKGNVVEQPALRGQYFVTRFKDDGTYAGKVALDIPFKPLQLGIFYNGDILIAGQDEASGSPRVAIVGSDGAFRRWVELGGMFTCERSRRRTARPRTKPLYPASRLAKPPEDR